MKVGIDGYFMSDTKSAWGMVQRNIILQLSEIDHGDELFIFADKEGAKYLPGKSNIRAVKVLREKDNFIYRIRSIKRSIKREKLDLDVYIETVEIAPNLGKNVKIFSLQHDFSHGTLEKHFSIARLRGKIYRWFQLSTITKSEVIFCNSHFTKNQLTGLIGYNKRILVFPLGIDPIYEDFTVLLERLKSVNLDIPEKFFLFVGRLTVRHKNVPILLEAFLIFSQTHPDYSIVLASSEDPTEDEKKLIDLLGTRVRFFKGLSTIEVAFLYSKATAFIFPSYYEGFGIPILEAQHMGCPLVLNDIPVFREVSGGAAIFFNGKTIDLVRAMEEVSDKKVRDELIKNGRENCKRYSWRQVAEMIYTELRGETINE
jgi:glycosyltransferase involved in cell wall biosynthesis